jgi:diguanylate cyclase (GGDEF)-like protein
MTDMILALEKAGKPFWFIAGVISLCGVAILDYATGAELSVSLFYLIPIAIFSWAVSGRAGMLSAVLSAGIWVTIEIITDNRSSNTFVYLWNAIIRFGFFLLPAILLRSLEQERAHARTDFLTGAFNNRYFHELMEREIDRSIRYKHPFTITLIDLDNFKTVNDTFGHTFGDTILRTISESMKRNLRKTDIVARVGGDEFAILLPETDANSSRAAVSNMLQKLSGELLEKKWPITFSIGVLTLLSPNISVDTIMGITDKMMYSVKNNGKNNVKYASYTNK